MADPREAVAGERPGREKPPVAGRQGGREEEKDDRRPHKVEGTGSRTPVLAQVEEPEGLETLRRPHTAAPAPRRRTIALATTAPRSGAATAAIWRTTGCGIMT